MSKNLSYGQALEAVKEGKLIARQGWNGKEMFVFMRPADELSINFIVHSVKSFPNSLKGYFADKTMRGADEDDKIKFTPYLCMKSADDSIVNGWLASQTDMLSEDWSVLNFN